MLNLKFFFGLVVIIFIAVTEVNAQCEIDTNKRKVFVNLDGSCDIGKTCNSLLEFRVVYKKYCFGEYLKVVVSPSCNWSLLEVFKNKLMRELNSIGISIFDVRFLFLDVERDIELRNTQNYVRISWVCICPDEPVVPSASPKD